MHCGACDKDYRDRINYLAHLKKIHFILATTETAAKYEGTVPDVDDPYNKCIVCKKRFSEKFSYHSHLRVYYGSNIPKKNNL